MALTNIDKLIEFAKDGQRSIQGLVLELGFPRDEKPARAWFNYLFNKSFGAINQLIDEVEYLRGKVEYLEVKDDIVITPPDAVDPIEPTPPQNKPGTWAVVSPPGKMPWSAKGTLRSLVLQHSSGEKVDGIKIKSRQIRAGDGYIGSFVEMNNAYVTSDAGVAYLSFYVESRPDAWPEVEVTVTAPNTETLVKIFYIWDGVPYSPTGGGGGNANQTE